eukprot:766167-Hanusia_phi.AAC.3
MKSKNKLQRQGTSSRSKEGKSEMKRRETTTMIFREDREEEEAERSTGKTSLLLPHGRTRGKEESDASSSSLKESESSPAAASSRRSPTSSPPCQQHEHQQTSAMDRSVLTSSLSLSAPVILARFPLDTEETPTLGTDLGSLLLKRLPCRGRPCMAEKKELKPAKASDAAACMKLRACEEEDEHWTCHSASPLLLQSSMAWKYRNAASRLHPARKLRSACRLHTRPGPLLCITRLSRASPPSLGHAPDALWDLSLLAPPLKVLVVDEVQRLPHQSSCEDFSVVPGVDCDAVDADSAPPDVAALHLEQEGLPC